MEPIRLLPHMERVARVLRSIGYAQSNGTVAMPGFLVWDLGGRSIGVAYIAKPEYADAGPMFTHWLTILKDRFGTTYVIEFHTHNQDCSKGSSRVHIHMTPR